MTDKSSWSQCIGMTRAQFRASGGCFWPVQQNSPGNFLQIPSGTLFKIRMEGPESSVYISGCCENGMFVVKEGGAVESYSSASAAVNAVRHHVEQSNAYLYIEFQVGTTWRLADDLRYDNELSMPPDFAEEKALEILREKVREKAKRENKKLSADELEVRAEQAFDKNPELVTRLRNIF